ncbi:MAG: YdcF family protein [Phycisphaerae bacterium]
MAGKDARNSVADVHGVSPSARGLALFFGSFGLLNAIGGWARPGFDANIWWMDLHPLPDAASALIMAVSSAALLALAIRPTPGRARRIVTTCSALLLLVVALLNSATFFVLALRGHINPWLHLPISLLVAASMGWIVTSMYRRKPVSKRKRRLSLALSLVAVLLLFPLMQMFLFGKTDYRRRADAAVIFGARAYADGTCSQALADRVRTGVELYRQGFVDKLIMSGGPGDGDVHETEAMKQLAVSLGVKPEDVLTDRDGLNTQHTVHNTDRMLREHELGRVLAVSHYYHLPRVKLAYARAGVEVYTVPARESRVLSQTPYLLARELAAQYVYYLRPLAG